jgi:hypothetical protein
MLTVSRVAPVTDSHFSAISPVFLTVSNMRKPTLKLAVLRGIFRERVLVSICDADLLVKAFPTPAVEPTLPDLVFSVPHVFSPPSPAALGPGVRARSV